jgi:hypothetical protein
MAIALNTTRPEVKVLPKSALVVPFQGAAGKKVTLGGVAMQEAKLSPAANKLNERLRKLSETGDGPTLAAYQLSPKDAQALLAKSAGLKEVLFDALTGAHETSPEDREGWWEGGQAFELKGVQSKDAFRALSKVFVSDEGGVEDFPDRPKLQQLFREILPSMIGGKDTRVFRFEQHDNGYGYYLGVGALNPRTGELHLALNSYAP